MVCFVQGKIGGLVGTRQYAGHRDHLGLARKRRRHRGGAVTRRDGRTVAQERTRAPGIPLSGRSNGHGRTRCNPHVDHPGEYGVAGSAGGYLSPVVGGRGRQTGTRPVQVRYRTAHPHFTRFGEYHQRTAGGDHLVYVGRRNAGRHQDGPERRGIFHTGGQYPAGRTPGVQPVGGHEHHLHAVARAAPQRSKERRTRVGIAVGRRNVYRYQVVRGTVWLGIFAPTGIGTVGPGGDGGMECGLDLVVNPPRVTGILRTRCIARQHQGERR